MQRKYFLLFLIFAIPLAVGVLAGYSIGHRQSANDQPGEHPSTPAMTAAFSTGDERDSVSDAVGSHRRNAITRVVAASTPAVVGINVTEVYTYTARDPWGDPFWSQLFGRNRVYQQEVKGLGSGFLISSDGYVLTNDHVAGNAKEITVTLTSKEKFKAKLVGTDRVSDIALLKIEGNNLPYLRLGNSDDVIIGEWAIAMGNPFGLFDINDKPTVTVGVISATGVNLDAQEGRYYRGMIQTDAAINSGNSGGPLLNAVGEVIGVNAIILNPSENNGGVGTNIGLGFAIPINRVKNVVEELKKKGKIERNLWTGLEVQNVDVRVARYFGLPKAEGVIVSDVVRESPAEKAGFKPGDIIIEANGEKIATDQDITSLLIDARAGDIMKMKVIRERKTIALDLRLEKGPQ
ncbi:MAG TPA: trypsin-like peptidase domain-containing protein [Bacteroidota bacterium]|nr:trypsin-like peptidase domain-containing protein [Bacteroidota bacterium]